MEDLHAADTPSLLLLHFLVRQLQDAPVLVLVTLRPPGHGSAADSPASSPNWCENRSRYESSWPRSPLKRSVRYERGSIILTYNKALFEWAAITGDEVLATVILDRLLHHCHVLPISDHS
ncbi:MAG: ATP-binding protein [Mycobacteriales bacterium]